MSDIMLENIILIVQTIIFTISGIAIPIILNRNSKIEKYQLHVSNDELYQKHLIKLEELCSNENDKNKFILSRFDINSMKVFAYTRPQLKRLIEMLENNRSSQWDIKSEVKRLKEMNNFYIPKE